MQRNNKNVAHIQAKKKQSSKTVYVLGDLDVALTYKDLKGSITSRVKKQKKPILINKGK